MHQRKSELFNPRLYDITPLLREVRKIVRQLHAGEIKFPPLSSQGINRKNIRYTPSFVAGEEAHGLSSVPYTALQIGRALGDTQVGRGKFRKAGPMTETALLLLELQEREEIGEEVFKATTRGSKRLQRGELLQLARDLRRGITGYSRKKKGRDE
jgi:hypothetical protein